MRLHAKLFALLLPAAIVCAAFLLTLERSSVRTILIDETERRGAAVASELADDAREAFKRRSERRLIPILQAGKKNSGALFAYALGSDGVVLAHTNVLEAGKKYDEPAAAVPPGRPAARRRREDSRHVLEVSAPVLEPSPAGFLLSPEGEDPGSRLGLVRLGLPLEPARETESRIVRRLAWALLITAVLGMATAGFLVRQVLQPIGQLERATRGIAEGHYGQTVAVPSRDEIGGLAESFNRMSTTLERTAVTKEYFSAILSGMHEPLVVLRPDGTIGTVNRACLELLGYREPELQGQAAERLFVSALAAEAPRPELLSRLDRIDNLEASLTKRDGTRVPVLLSGSALRDAGGAATGTILVARDIAKLKAVEEELRAANEELQAFNYMVSHDLRAPLRHIRSFCTLLQSSAAASLDERSRDFLDKIVRGAARMDALVEQLLAFSKAGRTALRRTPVDLGELVAEARRELTHENPGRKIVWDVGPLPTAQGDQGLLRQVVFNLMSNAVKYTGNVPEARITIAAAGRGGEEVVSIRDNGAGFDARSSDRLFKPFQRLHGQAEFSGSGIGLAIVAKIVGRHGGRVWAEGEPGRGACFYFSLPRD